MRKPDVATEVAIVAAATALALGANALHNSELGTPTPTPNTPALPIGSTPNFPQRSDIATQGGKRLWGGPVPDSTHNKPEPKGVNPSDGKPVKRLWGNSDGPTMYPGETEAEAKARYEREKKMTPVERIEDEQAYIHTHNAEVAAGNGDTYIGADAG